MKHKEMLKKEYAWVNENMPDASISDKEQIVRNRIFKRKIKKSGIIFLVSFVGYLISMLSSFKGTFVETLGAGIGSFGTIIAVMMFAKTLHDPLTNIESAEFRVTDSIEKTGRASQENIDTYEKEVKKTFQDSAVENK